LENDPETTLQCPPNGLRDLSVTNKTNKQNKQSVLIMRKKLGPPSAPQRDPFRKVKLIRFNINMRKYATKPLFLLGSQGTQNDDTLYEEIIPFNEPYSVLLVNFAIQNCLIGLQGLIRVALARSFSLKKIVKFS